ncbi:hypothetical protein Tco_0209707 [Tanacetum coccineum]
MANLEFCDKHNMVAYLKKPTGSEGFQEIVDFLNGSHIRFALTKNPTIYVSLIEKFCQTAIVRIVDNGEQEITTTADGKEFTITEASVRRHLQLADVDGISVLLTTEIFAQLSLMGYVLTDDKLTFQKGMLAIQAEEGEDEAVYKEWDDIVERATTTAARLDAAQASGNIIKTQSIEIPNVPLPQGIGASGSPSKLDSLKEDLKQTKQVYGASYTKLITKLRYLQMQLKMFTLILEEEGQLVLAVVELVLLVDYLVLTKIKLDEEERQRIARVHEEASSFNIEEWEDIQAIIEADEELAQRIQAKEREKYSKAEKARLLVELINHRKRYFAQQRAR